MRQARLAGAVILPPVMAYYFEPKSVDGRHQFLRRKILDALSIEHHLYRRWTGVQKEVKHEPQGLSLSCFRTRGELSQIDRPVDTDREMAGVISALEGKPCFSAGRARVNESCLPAGLGIGRVRHSRAVCAGPRRPAG